jgi:predicted nucleic acid-binding protein
MSVLLDSDIVIEILRSRDPRILSEWSSLAATASEILFSPVTAAEVWAGARPNELQTVAQFFRLANCIPVEYNIGQLAGELLSQFSKSHGLKIGDALIAATAIHSQSVLWTRNRKHYPMPGLRFLT